MGGAVAVEVTERPITVQAVAQALQRAAYVLPAHLIPPFAATLLRGQAVVFWDGEGRNATPLVLSAPMERGRR